MHVPVGAAEGCDLLILKARTAKAFRVFYCLCEINGIWQAAIASRLTPTWGLR
jgi:hypothetical protein